MAMNAKPRILVLGGGFGGLEAPFYLRMKLKDRANITMVSDKDHFLYKPNTIYIPFGLDPSNVPLDRPTSRKDIEFVPAKAQEIDPITKTVKVAGNSFTYDFLILATGAGMRAEEVPGLTEFAQTIWTPKDILRLRRSLNDIVAEATQDTTNGYYLWCL